MAIWTTTASSNFIINNQNTTTGSMTYDCYRNAWIEERPGYESWRSIERECLGPISLRTSNSFIDMLRAEIDGWLKGALDI